jgi:hypothetical protein
MEQPAGLHQPMRPLVEKHYSNRRQYCTWFKNIKDADRYGFAMPEETTLLLLALPSHRCTDMHSLHFMLRDINDGSMMMYNKLSD